MCGIVGYCGYQNAKNIIVDGLKTLEYRGYDSAGIALIGKHIALYKKSGRVSELENCIPIKACAHTAIGHTRWATHGKPTAQNAHPHLSQNKGVAVVHNGVIENCDSLKNELLKCGIVFKSDTDTEIIAQLLQIQLDITDDMLSSIEIVSKKLQGMATFLAIRDGDDKIYCHRKGASLAIGIGINENFVASDTLAITKYTHDVIILQENETAVLSPHDVKVYFDGKRISKTPAFIDRITPKECSCYMRSEIDEIPTALCHTYESIIKSLNNEIIDCLMHAQKIVFCGCGTAYHAALFGKEVFETLCGIPSLAVVASEFDSVRFLNEQSLVVLISQSGETADTINAIDICKNKGAKTIAITNVKGSNITFKSDYSLLLDAGAEIAVAATKSYNCQLYALYLLAKTAIGARVSAKTAHSLAKLCEEIACADIYEEKIKTSKLFFIGKGIDNITAQEGALKFKEITYKMTDAYASGELKHGTIALVDCDSVVIAIATNQKDKQRIDATICELRSRGAYTVAISSIGDLGADKTLTLPTLDDNLLYSILSVIPLQNLALSASLCLGLNPDKPRNLAKSVTVI